MDPSWNTFSFELSHSAAIFERLEGETKGTLLSGLSHICKCRVKFNVLGMGVAFVGAGIPI